MSQHHALYLPALLLVALLAACSADRSRAAPKAPAPAETSPPASLSGAAAAERKAREEAPKARKERLEARPGAGPVMRVASPPSFPEEAHNRYERLVERIEESYQAVGAFEKDPKSKVKWQAAFERVSDCHGQAEEFAEEYKGYPGIDKRLSELEDKKQRLQADKPA